MNTNTILLLSDPQMDYAHYMLTDGLIQILGEENIIIYPFKRAYNGGIDDWYYLDDGKKGFTTPIEQSKVWKNIPQWNIDDIIHGIKSGVFQFVTLFSARTYAIKAIEELIEKMGKENLPPIVFVDGEDYTDIRWNIITRYSPICYFKRELVMDLSSQNIYPLPFSAITNNLPNIDDTKKDIDVFFSCGRTYPLRDDFLRRLLRLRRERNINFVGGSEPSLPEQNTAFRATYKDYHRYIARSKIGISVRGFGMDTVRRWEVPTWNTLHICNKLNIIIPDDFKDKENIVYFKNDLSDFEDLILYFLENEEEQCKIASKGKEHLWKYHTTKARTTYFLSIVEKCLGGEM